MSVSSHAYIFEPTLEAETAAKAGWRKKGLRPTSYLEGR